MPDTDVESKNYSEVKIMIVDDDEVSVQALKRAIKKLSIVNSLKVAVDGVEALEILRGEAGKSKLVPPYIILLDINMPRMNGHEFLAQVRDDPSLHRTVIFVLTTSDAPEDVLKAYDKNVAGYVVKENPYETLSKTLELVGGFARLVVLPE